MNFIVKWFRDRRRANRRLALARIGWVAVLLLALAGCEQPPAAPQSQPIFQHGQIVNLRIGRRGQIIKVYVDGRNGPFYWVRVDSDYGPKKVLLNEFELRITE